MEALLKPKSLPKAALGCRNLGLLGEKLGNGFYFLHSNLWATGKTEEPAPWKTGGVTRPESVCEGGSPQEEVEVVARVTAAKSLDSRGRIKARGSSEHQAGPAEHKVILQHCEPGETCRSSLFPSLVATPYQKPRLGSGGGRVGGNEDPTPNLGFLSEIQLGGWWQNWTLNQVWSFAY